MPQNLGLQINYLHDTLSKMSLKTLKDVCGLIPLIVLFLLTLFYPPIVCAEDLGNLSVNPFNPNSISNPYGAGNRYNSNSIMNPYGEHGSPYSSRSWRNPYATDTPKLFDREGNYRGKLSTNPYDPDSISNPFGRYGSQFSPDSVNNPFGAGSPYRHDSPNNPYGSGWKIIDE
jgi:hypothetical protein